MHGIAAPFVCHDRAFVPLLIVDNIFVSFLTPGSAVFFRFFYLFSHDQICYTILCMPHTHKPSHHPSEHGDFSETPIGVSGSPIVGKSAKKKKKHKEFQDPLLKQKNKKGNNSEEKKLDATLAAIYENEDGSMPDMQRLEKRTSGRMVAASFTLLLSLFFLGGTVWAGYTFFQPSAGFEEADVVLTVSGDESVRIGQEVHYRIRYKNAQHVPLAKSTIRVRYPEGFTFSRASIDPINAEKNEWQIGALGEGDGAFFDMYGILTGNLGDEQTIRVFLDYEPANFSSQFQKTAILKTVIAESAVSISTGGATEAAPGSFTDLSAHLSFDASAVRPAHLALVFDGGSDFVLQKSTPQTDTFGVLQWNIPPDALEFDAALSGAFVSGGGSTATTTWRVLGWADGEQKSQAVVYASTDYVVALSESSLEVSVTVNGATGEATIQPGDILHVVATVKNSGKETVQDARVRLVFDAPSYQKKSILHWALFEDPLDGYIFGEQLSDTERRGSITWTKADVPALGSIAPGAAVTFDVRLPVKSAEDTDLSEFTTHVGRIFSDVQLGSGSNTKQVSGNEVALLLNSDTKLEVRDALEKNTNGNDVHTITWLVSNTFHALKDVQVNADLYGDILFDPEEAVVPAGTVSFDTEKKRLTWTISSMPIGVDVLALEFPVTLVKKNPTQTQLTSKIFFEATDTVTGKGIVVMGKAVEL